MAKDEEDEIVVPKKSSKTSKASSPSSKGPSAQMRRLMRITCGVGIALGGFVTLTAVMGVVGLVVDNIWARLMVGLLVVVGLPAFLADRLLKRSDSTLATRGGLGMVADVFAIVLLGIALVLSAVDWATRPIFRHEGDLYARAGSTTMARALYFVAGVAPVFPFEKPKAAGAASGSASSSSSGAPPPSR